MQDLTLRASGVETSKLVSITKVSQVKIHKRDLT